MDCRLTRDAIYEAQTGNKYNSFNLFVFVHKFKKSQKFLKYLVVY